MCMMVCSIFVVWKGFFCVCVVVGVVVVVDGVVVVVVGVVF